MNYLKTFFVWMWMWACDIVPGVSGGTIAFISWIYEKLLSSIGLCLSVDTFKLILRWRFLEAWKRVDWFFLLSVFGGILISIIVLSSLLESLLHSHPQLVWWFFAGLIVASIILLIQQQTVWWPKQLLATIIWWLFAWSITQIAPTEVIPHRWVIIWSAIIAISAMILPGLSGSFLLLIMWMYGHVISAINEFDFTFLLLFTFGIVVWLATFVRIVSRTFKKYHNTTIAVLIWCMIWALPKLWPRQNAIKTTFDRHGEEIVLQSKYVSPEMYAWDPFLRWVVWLFLIWGVWSYIIFSTIDQDV